MGGSWDDRNVICKGNYRIFSGYRCEDGYLTITTARECNEAAKYVQNNYMTVDTNVPSASLNPFGCYIYGSAQRGYTNLYYNQQGKTWGSWDHRNVICKLGA